MAKLTDKQFLAFALLWKHRYKEATEFWHPDYEGGRRFKYEGDGKYDIFNWTKREFRFYNRFTDNEKLTEQFFTDLVDRRDVQLTKDINTGAKEDIEVVSPPAETSQNIEQPPPGPTGTDGGGLPFMPGGGMYFSPIRPRRIYIVPQLQPEGKKLFVANSGGVVTQERLVTPTGAVYSRPYEAPQEILIANKNDKVVGSIGSSPANKSLEKETPQQPKLVTADRYGNIVKDPLKPPETPKLYTQDKSGIIREHYVKSPSRFSAFRSKIGRGITGAARTGLERANPFLKRMGTRGAKILSDIPNLGGGGGGGFSPFGRFGRNGGGRGLFGGFGKGGGGKGSLAGKIKGRGGVYVALGIIGFAVLVGGIAMSAPNPTPGQAAPVTPPIGGGGDISSCKFSRAGASTQFQSPLLLSYIQEAAQKANILPVVLAAFIRVESPASSNMSDTQISNYSATCAESDTGALGIMQIQPPGTTSKRGDPASCDDCIDAGAKLVGKTVSTMTRQDYCDPRTSIIVGAGWILKKISKLGYGDGTKWDPVWTNDRKAIEALVNTYYGCLTYGGAADCTGPYNYADDVSASVKSCQTTSAKCSAPGGSCPLISCPLSKDGSGSFDITCGTFKNPNSSGCGHGAPYPAYPVCAAPPYAVCPYSDQLKAAIDVRPSGQNGANTPIYLPFINGSSVNWTLASGPTTLNGGSWGVKLEYTATTADGKQILLDLTHLDSNVDSGANKSGDQVGITKEGVDKNGGHLHTAVSLNGNWLDSISETHICTP